MGERSRSVRARWRAAEATVWERELAQFGPLPARRAEPDQAARLLWQAEAYATIALEAGRARRQAAIQARRHGATYEAIGQALGISRQAAAQLVKTD